MNKCRFYKKLSSLLITVVLSLDTLLFLFPQSYAATITINNTDGASEGFNDPTAAIPVGGNSGTTVGQQRLNVFQHAADIWGALLQSSVVIVVEAQFNPLTCNASSAVLGSAGPQTVHRDFTGAPVTNTWYVQALANTFYGSDLDADNDDIFSQFNSSIDNNDGCLLGTNLYYGLDGSAGGDIDLLSIVIHELAHGLGFLSLVDLYTGAKFFDFDDAYMRHLEHHGAIPSDFPSMNNAQRLAAMTSINQLHWVGPHVVAISNSRLTNGVEGDGHVEMYAPNPVQPGSSVSHWNTTLTPNQLMEPFYTGVIHIPDLEKELFDDLGSSLINGVQHFLSYKGKITKRAPKFDKRSPVSLADQFENKDFIVKKVKDLYNPADKNGEGIKDGKTHLVSYLIKKVRKSCSTESVENQLRACKTEEDCGGTKGETKFCKRTPRFEKRTVDVENQFGTISVDIKKPQLLLVPSAKSLDNPNVEPLNPVNIDHFKCYKVKMAKGTGKFERQTVTLKDQFIESQTGEPKSYKVVRPLRLCTPVKKTVQGETTEIKDRGTHLMCYKVKKVKKQPKFSKIKGIHINNQFGPLQLDAKKEKELCVPSKKSL